MNFETKIEETIILTLKNVKTFENSEGVIKNVQNLPWRFSALKTVDESLKIRISCNEKSMSTLWSCSAAAEVSLLRQNSEISEDLVVKIDNLSFDQKKKHAEHVLSTWKEAIEPENGFIENDELKIQFLLKIHRIGGVRKRKTIDYSTHQPLLFNGILLVENRKVHVNKQILTMHSKFFENLFFGGFAEKHQEIIELPDVKHDEFLDFLNVIHPTSENIDENSVGTLLKLADRFQTDEVTARCEGFLISDKTIPVARKLIFAQQYTLDLLMDKCLKSFNNAGEMALLRKSGFYHELNDAIKSALLERLIKLQGLE